MKKKLNTILKFFIVTLIPLLFIHSCGSSGSTNSAGLTESEAQFILSGIVSYSDETTNPAANTLLAIPELEIPLANANILVLNIETMDECATSTTNQDGSYTVSVSEICAQSTLYIEATKTDGDEEIQSSSYVDTQDSNHDPKKLSLTASTTAISNLIEREFYKATVSIDFLSKKKAIIQEEKIDLSAIKTAVKDILTTIKPNEIVLSTACKNQAYSNASPDDKRDRVLGCADSLIPTLDETKKSKLLSKAANMAAATNQIWENIPISLLSDEEDLLVGLPEEYRTQVPTENIPAINAFRHILCKNPNKKRDKCGKCGGTIIDNSNRCFKEDNPDDVDR